MPVKQHHKSGRRPRIPLSCEQCRSRKLKCNREKPCQNCTARHEQAACMYKGSEHGSLPPAHYRTHVDPLQQRIEHLEDMVKRLIAQHQEIPTNDAFSNANVSNADSAYVVNSKMPDMSDPTHTLGTTMVDGTHSVYKGEDDWDDVLREINNLKEVWGETQNGRTACDVDSTHSDMVDGSSFLFGHAKQIDKIEILATLPSKPEVDKLIGQFFDYKNLPLSIPPILHQPTFMREYAEHWKDPSRTNIIWVGLLFSMLGIIMLSYHQFREPSEYKGISESLFQLYRLRTAQCLIAGDLAKCLPYTLETLRLNATAELNRKDDNRRGLWIMTGVIVRTAISMGYHRDPSQLSSISQLQAEYRRRVWLSVIGMDDVASFLLGFPRMMPAIYSDTMEPRNLHDWELSDDATVLSPSRPLSELTVTTYMIVKARLFRALGRIVDFNNGQNIGSYNTILDIDSSLHEAYQGFPSHMKVTDVRGDLSPMEKKSSFTNLHLQCMYYQGMCILHRRFIAKDRLNPRYNLSRERCICSGLALLKHQKSFEPSWYAFAQARQMLTLAAMILLLELECRQLYPDASMSFDTAVLLQALETSYTLWNLAKDSCDEALKVYHILAGMLSNFHDISENGSLRTRILDTSLDFPGFHSPFFPTTTDPFSESDPFAMFSNLEVDWAILDTFMEGGSYGNVD